MTSGVHLCFPAAAYTHSAGDTPAGKPGRAATHEPTI